KIRVSSSPDWGGTGFSKYLRVKHRQIWEVFMCLYRRPLVAAIALITLVSTAPAHAQPAQGRIAGVLRDATAIAVPGAHVTATDQTTHVAHTNTTGPDGSYSISVPPGLYVVTAALRGFRTVTEKVDVAGGASKQVDFTLEVALSQEVTVTATKREQTVID